MFLSLVVSLVLKERQEYLVLVSVVEQFLLPSLVCTCALYTWRIEDNMQELGTPGKFRSLSCVARTLALSFLATSVRINLKHVINVSTGGCVCVR